MSQWGNAAHTHTHTHTYIYIYMICKQIICIIVGNNF